MERRSTTLPPSGSSIAVRDLLGDPEMRSHLELVSGSDGLDRVLDHPRIQKSGLVLAGHFRGFVPTRVQILGETELSYLETLDGGARRDRARGLFGLRPSLVVVTRGVRPPVELLELAAETGTPLVVAEARSSGAIAALHAALDRLLAPREQRHGVMVEVHGIGMLLTGPSGIGKSECALFLVERGHRLVADDQVRLTRLPDDTVTARPVPLLRHHLEIRGLGILNIRDLFGATAVWDEAVVDLVVELCPFRDDEAYERLGLDPLSETVLGVDLPKLKIPVRPGRDMAVILEVAARNELLKAAGRHPARELVRRLSLELGLRSGPEEER